MLEVLRMASGWHYGKAIPFHIVSSCFLCEWETEKSTDIASPWGWMFRLLLWNQNVEGSGEKNWPEQNGRPKQKHFPVQMGSNPVIWESKCNHIFFSRVVLACTNKSGLIRSLSLSRDFVIIPKASKKGTLLSDMFPFLHFQGIISCNLVWRKFPWQTWRAINPAFSLTKENFFKERE